MAQWVITSIPSVYAEVLLPARVNLPKNQGGAGD